MTQQDLLTPDAPNETQYAALFKAQVIKDHEDIMQAGRIPAHIELDSILQKDEYRLLDLIETHGGYVMQADRTVQYGSDDTGLLSVPITRRVDSLTADAGFISPGNARATVNRCMDQGWITESVDVSGALRYDMTRMGRWAKDICEHDAWFDEEVET